MQDFEKEIRDLIKKALGQKSDFREDGICSAILIEAHVSCVFYQGRGMVCDFYEYETRRCLR